jgi:hypothetical protein
MTSLLEPIMIVFLPSSPQHRYRHVPALDCTDETASCGEGGGKE